MAINVSIKQGTVTTIQLQPKQTDVIVSGKGVRGVGIVSTVDNGNGTITFNYSDGTSFTTPNLTPSYIQNLSAQYEAGGTLGGQRLVQILNQAALYFDATDEGATPYGFTKTAANEFENVEVVSSGLLTSAGWGLTPNATYFAAENGLISTNIPTQGQVIRVGYAIDANTLYIDLSNSITI
jgi:hypothetical protein